MEGRSNDIINVIQQLKQCKKKHSLKPQEIDFGKLTGKIKFIIE